MNNKTLLIILGIAVVALILTLVFSGGRFTMGEGEDPAMALARSQSSRQSATSRPAETAPAKEPAAAETQAEAPAAEGTETAAAEEGAETSAAADTGAEQTEAPAEEPKAEPATEGAEQESVAEEGAEQPAAEAAEGGDESSDTGEAAAESEAGVTESADEDLMAEEELPEDPIERFKQMDPRDIIKAKYKDLEGRETRTYDEESPDYIPQTGRVDPLTRVSSAVPKDLKPPRSGETDQNLLETYLGTAAATDAVNFVAYNLFCLNVIQIGLSKRATFSFPPLLGERTFTVEEGRGLGLGVNGVNVTITVASIDTDSVLVNISGDVPGTSGQVTKRQTYIPRAYYH